MSGTQSGSRAPVLVIADDLTGANAAAAGFARAGLRAVTVGADRSTDLVAEFAERFDVVVVSTDSRHCSPEQAAAQIRAVVHAGWPAALVCDRVDSTLRGNVGASAAAALEAVRKESGRRSVALCAPAHPAAGRHTVQGTQLLAGTRLEETELARDPRAPVRTSDIAALVRAQADLRVAHLPLSAVTGDPAELRELIRSHLRDGAEMIIADALTEEHLDRAAAAAVDAGRDADGDDVVWIGVDPGPASVALARALGLTDRSEGAPVLAVSGSTTRLTRSQLERLRAEHPVTVVRPATAGDGAVPDVAATAEALAAALAQAGPAEIVLLATVLDGADVTPHSALQSERLTAALAQAVRRAMERWPVDGLYATGGDVSAALFAELEADGLDVTDEIVPLAVAGAFVGGPWAGLPVVTKGGLVGDAATTVVCVEQLRRAASAARRQVRSAHTHTPARRKPS
ncbi:four-carbon acid sugar kinase family protein [Streptomyces sp. N2-109]|uniref:Four-carbon acid sugar kinase family protein n=1 Tax=Streptomyces gossypii TaxID=2883101 RepID=A0ABT2JNC7_9ACTN|nr:four-carbon acid sugar kinase family protein [Streptomyces gossypii]MCT2588880.1 four-carbon acid sugar kinase family protein [Streptomyces gossypii]